MLSSPQTPGTRKPMKTLAPDKFSFNFENLRLAHGRNTTFLCFQVETKAPPSLNSPDSGIFQNQDHCPSHHHAEMVFLTWFQKRLSPAQHYEVTWYMSWSPCSRCAVQVAKFLKSNSTVNLSIFVARLYYPRELETKDGLHSLWQAGAQVQIMFFQDFKYCWENFVNNEGKPFQPWKNLDENSKDWDTELKDIHRNTTDLLTEEIFYSQFYNREKKSSIPRKTYLCYQLNEPQPVKRCLHYKKGYHAVTRFIDGIVSMNLDPARSYDITCYFTWSPCNRYARKLVSFIEDYPNLRLKVYTSRLYFHWCWMNMQGLQHLQNSRVTVAVMTFRDFEYCWKNFVDNQGKPFEPWEKLDLYSQSTERRLRRILKPLTPDVLNEDFGNLHL
ncbi:DNA dC-_dU-editing enzyme APOBEC-3-like isoform 1-T1 [Trichechus inunguis]